MEDQVASGLIILDGGARIRTDSGSIRFDELSGSRPQGPAGEPGEVGPVGPQGAVGPRVWLHPKAKQGRPAQTPIPETRFSDITVTTKSKIWSARNAGKAIIYNFFQ